MSNDWVFFCDICGQRHKSTKATKLTHYTGRGGLVVCPYDVDKEDAGLIPFTPRKEQNVSYVRTNHTNTTIGSPFVDLEEMAYIYFLASSQDNIILSPSQNLDQGLTVTEPL